MKCNHCLQEIPDDSKFCPLCGEKITRINTTAKETVSTEKHDNDDHYYSPRNKAINDNLKHQQSSDNYKSNDTITITFKKPNTKKVIKWIAGIAVAAYLAFASVCTYQYFRAGIFLKNPTTYVGTGFYTNESIITISMSNPYKQLYLTCPYNSGNYKVIYNPTLIAVDDNGSAGGAKRLLVITAKAKGIDTIQFSDSKGKFNVLVLITD